MPDGYSIKLVRDEIEKAVPALDGAAIRVHPVGSTTRRQMLRAKLLEEACEYLVQGGTEELADLLEVIESIALVDEGISFTALRRLQLDKRRERGGFLEGHVMFAVTEQEAAS